MKQCEHTEIREVTPTVIGHTETATREYIFLCSVMLLLGAGALVQCADCGRVWFLDIRFDQWNDVTKQFRKK